MKRHVWVIEFKPMAGSAWAAVDVEPNYSMGRRRLEEWKRRVPDDDVRLVKYVPAKP